MNLLSEHDHLRVSEAIHQAEKSTAGEIHPVVIARSDSYFWPALAILSVVMTVLAVASAWLARWLWFDVPVLTALLALVLAQALAAVLLWRFPALGIAFAPRRLRYRRAHGEAMRQFIASGTHRTKARTGVLLFLSMAERYGEVIGDAAINEKVSQEEWNSIVAALIDGAAKGRMADGFIAAIGLTGDLLARHFPPEAGDINELPDRLIEAPPPQ